ncbi:MAG: hypothetical protein WBX29_01345 [Nitrososphaeraceae archaeon]
MYEKDPYHVNDLIDGSGVNVGVGTNNTWWCRSRTFGELGEKRNEETSKDKDQDGTSRIHGD